MVLIYQWRREYNQVLAHSAKDYHPSAPEAILIMVTTQEVVQLLGAGHLTFTYQKNMPILIANEFRLQGGKGKWLTAQDLRNYLNLVASDR
jgi:hypothetical protein